MRSPVAILIFNRPELTQRVFKIIRMAQPSKLLVVADGPRTPEDEVLCQEARAITESIDWDCEVHRNYVDTNLGCRNRIASGLDWVFQLCEEAIILEDDCVPHPTFFRFCDELLERYRDDERVMMVLGNSFLPLKNDCASSYHFSYYPAAWGWASWRRVWKLYDVDMNQWPNLRRSDFLVPIWRNRDLVKYWQNIFDRTYAGEIDTWDFQLFLTIWTRQGLVATSNTNLISNIGFGPTATHTRHSGAQSALKTGEMEFPLQAPKEIVHEAVCAQPFYEIWDRKAKKWSHGQKRGRRLFQRLLSRIVGVG